MWKVLLSSWALRLGCAAAHGVLCGSANPKAVGGSEEFG
jgi:hypothetical protein